MRNREEGAKGQHTIPLELGVPLSVSGSHAGEFETSMMLATHPEWVRMEAAEGGVGAPFASIEKMMMSNDIDAVSANGVLGDQRAAEAGRGHIYLDALANYLAKDLRHIRRRIQEEK